MSKSFKDKLKFIDRMIEGLKNILPDITQHFRTPFVPSSQASTSKFKFRELPNRGENQDFYLILISTIFIVLAFFSESLLSRALDFTFFVIVVLLLLRVTIVIVDYLFFRLMIEGSSDRKKAKILLFKSNLNSYFLLFSLWILALAHTVPFGVVDEIVVNTMTKRALTSCTSSPYWETCVRHEYQSIILLVTEALVVFAALLLAFFVRSGMSAALHRDYQLRRVHLYFTANWRNITAMSFLIVVTYILIRTLFGSIVENFSIVELYLDKLISFFE